MVATQALHSAVTYLFLLGGFERQGVEKVDDITVIVVLEKDVIKKGGKARSLLRIRVKELRRNQRLK